MTFDGVQIGDKLTRMGLERQFIVGVVVGKDYQGPKNKGPELILDSQDHVPVVIKSKDIGDWRPLQG